MDNKNSGGGGVVDAVRGVIPGGLTRRQLRQKGREELRLQKEHAFFMGQKVTRAEFQGLINDYMSLKKNVSDYMSFVRNIFFVLEHKKMVTLDEMDKLAAQRGQEAEIYKEIRGNSELSPMDKIAMAKEKGLSDVYLDLLSAPEPGIPITGE